MVKRHKCWGPANFSQECRNCQSKCLPCRLDALIFEYLGPMSDPWNEFRFRSRLSLQTQLWLLRYKSKRVSHMLIPIELFISPCSIFWSRSWIPMCLLQGSAPPTIFVVKRGFLRMVRKLSSSNDEQGSGVSRIVAVTRPGLKIQRLVEFNSICQNR